MSSSIWFVLAAYESEPDEGFDRETAERIADERTWLIPKCGPHRAVRYDLADPERDRREAEALDHVLTSWMGPEWLAGENAHAREILEALRNRLKGNAQ